MSVARGVVLLVAFALLGLSQAEDQDYYKAAVVEYTPLRNTTANIEKYVEIVKNAKEKGAEIVVFPEGTLNDGKRSTSKVPHGSEKVTPHSDSNYDEYPVMKLLSLAAKENEIYVVINVLEGTNDTKGGKEKVYNTNVAFDRNGTVISRYRKNNLFDEISTDRPEDEELVTFDTDFGVTFGMIICFDILFKRPSMDLVSAEKTTNIIFSNYWFGELPFLTAAQMQAGWSHSMNVNLLASGGNNPKSGTTGSGLYAGKKDFKQIMTEEKGSWMIIGELPKNVRNSTGDLRGAEIVRIDEPKEQPDYSLYLKADPSLAGDVKSVKLTPSNSSIKICHSDFCCQLQVESANYSSSDSGNEYSYKVVVYSGKRKFGMQYQGSVQYCAVVLCVNDTCGVKPSSGDFPMSFSKITLEAEFSSDSEAFQMPDTLEWMPEEDPKMFLQAMPADKFSFEPSQSGQKRKIVMTLKEPTTKLVTFGIFGRSSAGALQYLTSLILAASLFLNYVK